MASTDTEVIIIFTTALPLFRPMRAAAAVVIAVWEQRCDQQQLKSILEELSN